MGKRRRDGRAVRVSGGCRGGRARGGRHGVAARAVFGADAAGIAGFVEEIVDAVVVEAAAIGLGTVGHGADLHMADGAKMLAEQGERLGLHHRHVAEIEHQPEIFRLDRRQQAGGRADAAEEIAGLVDAVEGFEQQHDVAPGGQIGGAPQIGDEHGFALGGRGNPAGEHMQHGGAERLRRYRARGRGFCRTRPRRRAARQGRTGRCRRAAC